VEEELGNFAGPSKACYAVILLDVVGDDDPL